MMKVSFLALLASTNAFSLVASPRKPFRAAVSKVEMEAVTYDVAAFREYEECIVDAENAAEQSACMDMDMDSTPAPAPAGLDFMGEMRGFFARFNKKPLDYDVEECIV